MHRKGTQHSMSDLMNPSQRHICTVMGTVGMLTATVPDSPSSLEHSEAP
uniref:Uncharacterized protein n=1 Tax=Anguilla anguilla TaxID=7936 RepID=A0A0E9Y0W2_ANGAN